MSVARRTGHASPQTSAASHTSPSALSGSLAAATHRLMSRTARPRPARLVLECEVQPVKPAISPGLSSAEGNISGTGSPVSYQRDLSVFTVWNLNWLHRAFGKTVPGDLSSSGQ